jgi:hypothetical protein
MIPFAYRTIQVSLSTEELRRLLRMRPIALACPTKNGLLRSLTGRRDPYRTEMPIQTGGATSGTLSTLFWGLVSLVGRRREPMCLECKVWVDRRSSTPPLSSDSWVCGVRVS